MIENIPVSLYLGLPVTTIDHMQLEFLMLVNCAAHHVHVLSTTLSGKKIFENDGEWMSKQNDRKITLRG